jgi:spore coat protein A, manganese oxidase
MRRAVLCVAVVGSLCAAPAARADETIYGGPPSQYFTPTVSPDQGETVTFTNLDLVDHDVVASGTGPDGAPLFRSEIVGRGASSVVAGTEFLTTGDYGFFCSIHPNMKGTINVTSAGSPKPRPGAGGSSPAPPPGAAPASDTRAPALRLAVLDRRLSTVRRRRALRVRVTSDEPATVGLTVRAGRRTLGGTTVRVPAGRRTVTIRLRRRPTSRLTVVASAADGAGNTTNRSTRRTLRGR